MLLSATKQTSVFRTIGISTLLLLSLLVTRAEAADARVERLARSVTIYHDNYGVPHVYGPTDASCVFGFAYAQAEITSGKLRTTTSRRSGVPRK